MTSICGYCATGCQLKLHLDEDGAAINLSPQAGYPVNLGMACLKGWKALDPLDSPDRAVAPLLRDKSGKMVATDWPTTLEAFTTRLEEIPARPGRESRISCKNFIRKKPTWKSTQAKPASLGLRMETKHKSARGMEK